MEMHGIEAAINQAEIARKELERIDEFLRYQRKTLRLHSCYSSWASAHIALAIHDYYVKGEIASLKQHLHVATKLKIASIALDDYQRFQVGNEIRYALLSDNPALIDAIAKLEPPYFLEGRSNPLNAEFKVHMWQLAIRGDYEALQAKVERLAKNGRKKDRELPAQGKDFFSLLMRGDKQGLEDLITQHAKVKSKDVFTEDFMCFEGTIEAKICWLKGIQVQIDSPLLPMDLMPIEPLEHYDDVYDFLSPGYVPPKVGLMERMRYWFRQRSAAKF